MQLTQRGVQEHATTDLPAILGSFHLFQPEAHVQIAAALESVVSPVLALGDSRSSSTLNGEDVVGVALDGGFDFYEGVLHDVESCGGSCGLFCEGLHKSNSWDTRDIHILIVLPHPI